MKNIEANIPGMATLASGATTRHLYPYAGATATPEK